MDAKAVDAHSSRRWSRVAVVVAVLFMLLDVVRLVVLPQAYQETFMDGFEAVVGLLCAVACGFAAARSTPVGKGLWIMPTIFFVLMAVADFHDFLQDISLVAGPLSSAIDFLGWCAYIPLALLIFFPIEKGGRPDWSWLSFLDFLLVTGAVTLATFQLIYLPRSLMGQPWTVIGYPELVRNVLLSGGLLMRMGFDPSPEARAFYWRVAGVFAGVTFLRGVFPEYLNPIVAVARPALWLALGILAVHWEDVPGDRAEQAGRRGALSLFLSLSAAATMFLVVALALSAPAPYRRLMYISAGISAVLFILRSSLAEHSRHASETKLRTSEQDYRVLFESAVVPILIFEPETERILQSNAAACELYGVAPGGLVGASLREFTKDVARGETQIAELLRTGACQKFESVHLTRDGREINVLVSSSVVQYRGQMAILSFNRDVTKRRRAEEALRESEERFRSLVENATVGIYRTTPDGRILMANPALVKMLGYNSLEDLRSRNLENEGFEPNYPRSEFKARLEQKGEVRGLVEAWTRRDGTTLFIRESARAIRDSGGAILFFDGIVEDITEQKRVEEALHQSEARFRTLIEQAPVAIGISRKGMIFYANRKYLEMYGFESVEEIVGRSIGEQWAPEFRGMIEERARQRSLGLKVPSRYEATGQRKDGSQFPVQVEVTMVNLPDGPALIGFLTDITERKSAEEQIKASEEKFRKAFMTGADAFYIATLNEGRILEVNDRFQDVFGYSRDEAIGKTSLELGLYADPDDRRMMVSEIKAKGHVRNLQLKGRRKGGDPIILLISVNLLQGNDGQLILGVVRDITEHTRAEESLIRLHQAVDASGEVIFMTDREGIITFVNPEFSRLYGYSEEEVLGKVTPRILKSGVTPPENYAKFWRTILEKRVARGEVINKSKDNKLVTVESSVNPVLDKSGNIEGFLAIQRDITGRKQLEEQFRQAQKMEAVGRLAGGVAHDFNNLLTIINGYAQLLLERFRSEDGPSAQLREILSAGERATGLTRQLLAFSRKQVLEPKILDLNDVMEGMQKMLRRLIGEDVELHILPGKGLGLVKADPTQIEQVILNLAVNARDAMPYGGKLTIETANAELDEGYARTQSDVIPGHYVMLGLRDTGVGMDPQTLVHIFEPFFTTKERGKGTGLGLSTVYGIVKQTGGHISVHSEPGHGTTFNVYLPGSDRVSETSAQNKNSARPLGGSETILLVEDEEAVRALAVRVLKEYGYRVLDTTSPRHAVELSERQEQPIDLLLTDVVMPGMSGRDIAKHLGFTRPKMKVLYVSGYTDDIIAHHGVLEPGTAFLQKPFTPEALARKVREVLDQASLS